MMSYRLGAGIGVGLLMALAAACVGAPEAPEEVTTGAEPIAQNGVDATLSLTSDWGSGYCAQVTLKNGSTVAVSSWQVVLNTGGSAISQIWSATSVTSGTTMTVSPASYSASIPAAGSTSFGFCGTGSGRPSVTLLSVTGGQSSSSKTSSSGSSSSSSAKSSASSSKTSSSTPSSSSKSSSSSSSSSSSGAPKGHVFLLLGQSNMAGYPKAQASDKVQNTRIQVLGFDDCAATGRKKNQWGVAVPPLHECYQSAIGPGDWFSKTIISKYPAADTVYLVPDAHSGQAIETMIRGGTYYADMLSRAKLGQQKGAIEGMLFHQGESNCGDPAWPNKVKELYNDLKADLGLTKDVPFLAGELAPTGACSKHNTLVDQLPSVIGKNTYVISSQGLVLDPSDTQWHLHFDHDSQVTFGKRYAATMITALGL